MSCIFRQSGTHPYHIRNSDCPRSCGNPRCHLLYQVRSIITANKRSCGKVIFSRTCVCHSVQVEGRVHYPWCIWKYEYSPGTRHGTYPPLLLLTSGGHHWRPVQSCSLENLSRLPTVLTSSGGRQNTFGLASGRYVSYWNAILYFNINILIVHIDIKSEEVHLNISNIS